MKVYLLIKSEFDVHGVTETIDAYYRNKVDAEKEMSRLNEVFEELDRASDGWSDTRYWVEDQEVL